MTYIATISFKKRPPLVRGKQPLGAVFFGDIALTLA